MRYFYEQLGPERFQHLCQALIAREKPDVQCLPVAQPDGGRDALSYLAMRPRDEAVVFQVKYARRPGTERDSHKWLVQTLEAELPKIKRLVARGASAYYLLTNVSGTAHPDGGAVDLAQELLDRGVTVDAHCWWRDDLDRRLDDAWDIKWVFPEIWTGTDAIRALAEAGLTEHRERRENALRAFLRDQYNEDQEVRFKQIELQNDLLDLFVDVPLTLGGPTPRSRKRHLDYAVLRHIVGSRRTGSDGEDTDTSLVFDEPYSFRNDSPNPGAATALLHRIFQENFPYLVLEGAPGQGKSTLVQYVCQVHRMRLLGERTALARVDVDHQGAGAFLPIKIELRDYATWLSRRDPFAASSEDEPPEWHPSLEAFVAALIRYHSGGADFNVSDVQAVFRVSAVLLVLDALDEVPDISARQEVVREVSAAVPRIQENAAALQVVVTSRPAAFANSPGFSPRLFRYAELTPLPAELIDQYSDRWLAAKKLPKRESDEVRRLVQQRLSQPHLRDLSRNPMQLAILLSLVHSRGSSLPDKRTALYDNYIELFFSREAEKSSTIREHRDLLIQIHQYLAWKLHTEAEQGGRGVISHDELKTVLHDYLKSEQHDVELVDELFSGMVERVVALVSRVQGTYEFEVQPLREYFVARYLYETAPYSPTGRERRGTKPERFDALARNFYWLNVTRFYAGCYSRGEFASLVDRLDELASNDELRFTSYPRSLAAMLLSDWVFTQEPRSVKRVVDIALNGLGLRHALDSAQGVGRPGQPFVLPERNGRADLVAKCIELIRDRGIPIDYAHAVVRLLNANTSNAERLDIWREEARNIPTENTTRWLTMGQWMGILGRLSYSEVLDYLKGDAAAKALLLEAGHVNAVHDDSKAVDDLIDAVLKGEVVLVDRARSPASPLSALALALQAPWFEVAFLIRGYSISMADAMQRYGMYPGPFELPSEPFSGALGDCMRVYEVLITQTSRSVDEWASTVDPWHNIVEEARNIRGTQPRLVELATTAAGIRSREERFADARDLFDEAVPLTHRVRHARLRAGQPHWWETTAAGITSEQEALLLLMPLLTWGSPKTISALAQQAGDLLDSLSPSNFSSVMRGTQLRNPLGESFPARELIRSDVELPRNASPRLIAAIASRSAPSVQLDLWNQHLSDYDGKDPHVLALAQRTVIPRLLYETKNWKRGVDLLEETYTRGGFYRRFQLLRARAEDETSLPLAAARAIVEKANSLPYEVVAIAEEACRADVAKSVRPVGDVASRDSWWNDSPRS